MADTHDNLGDRMKGYEQAEGGRSFLPGLPIVVRIDGKCFSSWTRHCERPFDAGLHRLMVLTTKELVHETGAVIGYTQSDEISLVLYGATPKTEVYFCGKIQKLVSVLASIATAEFNNLARLAALNRTAGLALFDCRAWVVPSKAEAANALLWRELDAAKNSVSMAAHHYYSHRELMNKRGHEMQEMLHAKGVNWNDYPAAFKRGTFVRRITEERPLTQDELMKIITAHRPAEGGLVTRSRVVELEMPKLRRCPGRRGRRWDTCRRHRHPEESTRVG